MEGAGEDGRGGRQAGRVQGMVVVALLLLPQLLMMTDEAGMLAGEKQESLNQQHC